MSDKKILFICEGSVDEPELLKALVNKVLPSKIKYSIYS